MSDFGGFPPEIHSARIYSGPGSAAMQAAASAWSGLASELNSAATAYETVVGGLNSEEWSGPASAAMVAAITPYVAWMRSTAAQAEQTAGQARSAAAAYDTALAAVVPPPQIAANRVQLASLISTNVLGQNTAAIAATEAQYGEMWAQDAAAMFQYAAASAVASALTHYVPPPQTTTPAAAANQTGAVAHAAATSAGAAQSALAQLTSSLPAALQSLSSPLSSSAATSAAESLQQFLNWYGPFGNYFYDTLGLPFFGAGITSFFTGTAKAFGLLDAPLAAAPAAAAAAAAHGAEGLAGSAGVSATLANAGSVGRLSVPAAWPGATPMATAAAAPSRFVSEVIEPEHAGHAGSVLGGMPVGSAGKAAAGAGPRYGVRPTVMAQPPSAG